MTGNTRVNPGHVETFMRHLAFPATKQEILQHARDNEAPSEILSLLERIEERDYMNAVDVAVAAGNAE